MSDFKQYQRKGLSEMRPYIKGEDLSNISVAPIDGPETDMGMVARNPKNHKDQWYVARKYFNENLELAISEPEMIDLGTVSDGYHTFDELYEFRKLYNAAFFNGLDHDTYHVHKSTKHFEGDECFGGGWFIAVAVLPTGMISNHYEMKDWDLFHIPEVERSTIKFDGHTPKDVVARLTDYIRGSY